MTFEFLIACDAGPEGSVAGVKQALAELLTRALNDTGAEYDPSMLQISHIRRVDGATGDNGDTLVGFAIELPGNEEDEDTVAAKTAIDGFTLGLRDNPQVFHALCFEDPLLRVELARYAVEIFALEMKLRRVLSFIYLNAHQLIEPFNVLKNERIGLNERERLMTDEQMRELGQNQFFRLTFSDYIRLNQRAGMSFDTILRIVGDTDEYGAFRSEMLRQPVEDEEDANFLTNLKAVMRPIENMRNCVAHNRRPTPEIYHHYNDSHPKVEKLLDDCLARWEGQG